MKSKRLTAAEGNTLPPGWYDEIVCHTFRNNRDGTISVIALVNIYATDGRVYSTDRTMRLRQNKKGG